ncbi:uncharacterized protein Z518_03401 [Rhinocladiella mackenziei CBS 650.93]|uniref:Ribosome biogenesis protein Alb1 n=1 Tax=Rhinocladiella mackenziei CBS 650.93 TaxID=1442369 RepID=A0A0D2IRX2_9EURO|nr:uncharacterized protein Z518_03401 [Rhinocladiella mackenziei CBS 650.93]KIX08744.1 hypothetical protein Z518_03401 [Rhinocladiella mackenziei CBS 650.93]
MAKTAKVKKDPTTNPKSRASKRAASPSINVDESLRDAPRASDATPILSARPNGGVTKLKRKQKSLTRGQRRRHEKGLARAEVVLDQLAKKVDDASSRLRRRRERKSMWDEVNGTAKFDKMKVILSDNTEQVDGDEWEDEAMEAVKSEAKVVEDVNVPTTAAATKLVVVDRTTSAPMTDEEDEADKIT